MVTFLCLILGHEIHFTLTQAQVEELTAAWGLNHPTKAVFIKTACTHFDDVAESDREVF